MDKLEIDLDPLDKGNYVEWCVDYIPEDGQPVHAEFFVVLQGTRDEQREQLAAAAIAAVRPQVEALGKEIGSPLTISAPLWLGR